MTRDDVIRMALEAGFAHCENYSNGWLNTMERFAYLVAASERQKHQADIERWKADAATAEKWRGIACAKHGDGRTVQLIQQEAATAEREAWIDALRPAITQRMGAEQVREAIQAAIQTRCLCTIEHDNRTSEGKEK